MKREMEFEGRSVEDAVQKASRALRLSEAELDYSVIDEGSGGLFGLGSRPVRIKAVAPERTEAPPSSSEGDEDNGGHPGIVGPAPEKAAQAKQVSTELVTKMGLRAEVVVRDEERQIVIELNEVEGSNDIAEAFGGSRPPALPSFQFLLNKIVNRFPEDRKHIVVEAASVAARTAARRAASAEAPVNGHSVPKLTKPKDLPEDVDPELAQLAERLAEKAVELGKVITIHPMPANDRRSIHLTISSMEGVETISEGDGLYRKMHIVPAQLLGAGAGGGGQRKRRRRRRRRGGRGAEGGAAEVTAE